MPVGDDACVSDGVDAAVHWMQEPPPDSTVHLRVAEPTRKQLRQRDDAELPPGDHSDLLVDSRLHTGGCHVSLPQEKKRGTS